MREEGREGMEGIDTVTLWTFSAIPIITDPTGSVLFCMREIRRREEWDYSHRTRSHCQRNEEKRRRERNARKYRRRFDVPFRRRSNVKGMEGGEEEGTNGLGMRSEKGKNETGRWWILKVQECFKLLRDTGLFRWDGSFSEDEKRGKVAESLSF